MSKTGGDQLEKALKADPFCSKCPLLSWKNLGLLLLGFRIFQEMRDVDNFHVKYSEFLILDNKFSLFVCFLKKTHAVDKTIYSCSFPAQSLREPI